MKCDVCNSEKITYLKQVRVDKVVVVTARCENNHIPEKGKPFYSIHNFNLSKLDTLNNFQKKFEEKKKSPYRNYPLPIEDNPL